MNDTFWDLTIDGLFQCTDACGWGKKNNVDTLGSHCASCSVAVMKLKGHARQYCKQYIYSKRKIPVNIPALLSSCSQTAHLCELQSHQRPCCIECGRNTSRISARVHNRLSSGTVPKHIYTCLKPCISSIHQPSN